MYRKEPQLDLFHERFRRFADGLARCPSKRPAAISSGKLGMATGGIVQAALCADHPLQHRSHFFAYSIINEHHIPKKRAKRTPRSGFVTKIALLGVVDNLGAGLVGPLISYWFFRRFGVELKSLGLMFFLSYFFAALSFLAAPVLARYMGIVKTMAFSHGLASLIYLFLPLAPSFSIAAAMTVVRSLLAYMDNPLRSSFIMGIVRD